MRVITHVGSRAGDVINVPVPVGRVMLADGRASVVPDTASSDDVPESVPVPIRKKVR